MNEIETFESGVTVQVTFSASLALDAPPILEISNEAGTIVSTSTAVSSSETQYFGLYTTPDSPGIAYYLATWRGTKTFVDGARPIVQRVPFRVRKTEATG